ncbi:MAG: bifunctional phosphopantothenoylcysteine decarboxylase/phosphopantothenate--cysteine ligase CoaBC [Candidatus Thorarchaeota archaeon]
MQHTSKLIKGSLSSLLKDKAITLCITGSVAAVESVHIARRLMRHGAEVYCVMSKAGQEIIHPHLMEWATGNPVVTELTGKIEHITLAGKHEGHVDLVLIAPSTANTIGKIANGIDDTTVTTTVSSAIGAKIPVIIVPAMHASMYEHPAVLENIGKLQKMQVDVINPRREEAKAKIPSVDTIVDRVLARLGPRDLEGKHFVISAGPTRGWLDAVRFISNPSTGKMGIAITSEILSRGGEVTLILGPTSEIPPDTANVIRVETSQEMFESVLKTIETTNPAAFISTAAVLDYTPSEREERKRPSGKEYSIQLQPTNKIIDAVRERFKTLFIIGFKVESGVSDDELEKRARKKIDTGICDLVVGNDAARKGVAFGTDTNEVLIVGKDAFKKKIPLSPKREIALVIIDTMCDKL